LASGDRLKERSEYQGEGAVICKKKKDSDIDHHAASQGREVLEAVWTTRQRHERGSPTRGKRKKTSFLLHTPIEGGKEESRKGVPSPARARRTA